MKLRVIFVIGDGTVNMALLQINRHPGMGHVKDIRGIGLPVCAAFVELNSRISELRTCY